MYKHGENGSKTCPNGFVPINSKNICEKAVKYLNVDYGFADIDISDVTVHGWARGYEGCFVNQQPKGFFRNKPITDQSPMTMNSNYHLICEKTSN